MAAPMRHLFSRRPSYLQNKFVIRLLSPSARRLFSSTSFINSKEFDPKTLDTIACPLSKGPLRYDATASELVNDELGVAYKIIDGIPNLIPEDARMIQQQDKDSPGDDGTSVNSGGKS